MKTRFILIFLLTISISFAQNEIETIDYEKNILIGEIENFIKVYNIQDFKAQVDYYPEAIADSISKRELVLELEKFQSENPKSKKEFDINYKIDTLLIENSNVYSKIELLEKLTIDFSNEKNKPGMENAISMVYKDLISKFGKKNVEHDKAKSKFVVFRKVELFGIKNSGINWRFIESIYDYPIYFPKGINN